MINSHKSPEFYFISFCRIFLSCWALEPIWPQTWASQVALVIKNQPANAGDGRWGSTLESGRSPGGGQGHPLQYSCLENSMDRGAWWAMIHRVTKSQTRLKGLSMHPRLVPNYKEKQISLWPCLGPTQY